MQHRIGFESLSRITALLLPFGNFASRRSSIAHFFRRHVRIFFERLPTWFFYLPCAFSYISVTTSVSFDLTELGNKVAKIKVNQRGNLWATGHFMGKKSVMDSPLLQSPDGQSVDAFEVALSPEQNGMGNLQDVLWVALQAQLRDDTENRSKNQETGLLMKILESYIQNNRK